MAFDPNEGFGVWRDLDTGVDPVVFGDQTQADGANDGPGDPGAPIATRIDGPWGLPWFEGLENPDVATGLTASPDMHMPEPDVGKEPIVGAYEGAFRTMGPVGAWGYEPSGGLGGDQAIGRIMRFPANVPERYDANGVANGDYLDELAGAIAANDSPTVTDTEITTSLLMYPNVGNY